MAADGSRERHSHIFGGEPSGVSYTVELVGEGTHEIDRDVDTYADLLRPFNVSRHEVSILVDGTPVPEDQPVDADVDRVQVVRLIKGG